ncbi:DUF5990 family protein [Streptomyces sp. NPDC057307]|uniref:DUF5990 family protein n=1 Tax=Streptomyces sp. NPDC057307 TaxID=3346096 RepID=UPI00364431DC
MALLTLRILGHDLPGADCGEFRHVHVGTQRGGEPDQLVSAGAAGAVFEIPVETVTAVGSARSAGSADGEAPGEPPVAAPDFRGPYVQGRRGARFVYLTWGELPPGGDFEMFRRAKIFLADVPGELLDAGTVETPLGLTDAAGLPLCAAVRPPAITWAAAARTGA